jgi:hypothetical protein
MILTLYDETGEQTLPPGILVTVSTLAGTPRDRSYWDESNYDEMVFDQNGSPVGAAYTGVGGVVVLPDNTLIDGLTYTVSFRGNLGPQTSIPFTYSVSSPNVTILEYVVPEFALDADGWQSAAVAIGPLPTWFLGSASPVASSMLKGYAAVEVSLGSETKTVLAALRPQTSVGDDLVSLAADFFGAYLPKRQGESDSAYYGRFLANFKQRSTLPDVKAAVLDFFANDQADNSASHDVFDYMSDPARAAYYQLDGDAAEFAIISYFPNSAPNHAWFIGQSFIGQNTVLRDPWAYTKSTIAPFPLLGQRIEQHRAKGTRPVYISSPGEPADISHYDEAYFGQAISSP